MRNGFHWNTGPGGLGWWTAKGLEGPRHGFSTRLGGLSEGPYRGLNLGKSSGDAVEQVEANRALWLTALGLAGPLSTAHQVHGATVLRATACGDQGDALIALPGEGPIGVITADCTPLLLWDPTTGMVAAIHAGWKGAALGVVPRTVKAMGDLGAEVGALRGAIGPHLGPCCMEVGPEVRAAGAGQVGWEEAFLPGQGDRLWLNQGAACRAQLLAAGLQAEAVVLSEECTRCQPERYYSWRGQAGTTGRMMATIAPVEAAS